ncbi:predicted protein [Uncinocarpus reesii 1704]|uniref:Uncharacterized protein n=1 Tax=Uncinocarpus reesii (strain UAMH 1704) TaxID=336963 RepID=C4JSS0_UNCRE|nr:uncharacterized protein UREG_05509 [Uncinocarpus reesii 1704]EEP80667.1 predicted protein [Uncinocarpus reesii 1704]
MAACPFSSTNGMDEKINDWSLFRDSLAGDHAGTLSLVGDNVEAEFISVAGGAKMSNIAVGKVDSHSVSVTYAGDRRKAGFGGEHGLELSANLVKLLSLRLGGFECRVIGIANNDVIGAILDLLHDGLEGEIPNQCGAAEPGRQRGKEFWQRDLVVLRREQSAEQRQYRVARWKRGEHLTVAFDAGAGEEASVGFPSANAMTHQSHRGSRFSSLDDDGVGMQKFSNNHAQTVAAEEAKLSFRGHEQRMIAVATQILDKVKLGLVDGFGIDRHEAFAAADGCYFSAKLLENLHEKITADGGVLVDKELHALKRLALEEIKVAQDVDGFCCV